MRHIPSILSIPDGLTKALGWILHSRHMRRMMAHFTAEALHRTFAQKFFAHPNAMIRSSSKENKLEDFSADKNGRIRWNFRRRHPVKVRQEKKKAFRTICEE